MHSISFFPTEVAWTCEVIISDHEVDTWKVMHILTMHDCRTTAKLWPWNPLRADMCRKLGRKQPNMDIDQYMKGYAVLCIYELKDEN